MTDPGPLDSGMRAWSGQDWKVPADRAHDEHGEEPCRAFGSTDHKGWPQATLRQVGWLDQKGRVWLRVPPAGGFDGGSLTPLLIDVRET